MSLSSNCKPTFFNGGLIFVYFIFYDSPYQFMLPVHLFFFNNLFSLICLYRILMQELGIHHELIIRLCDQKFS